MIPKIVATLSGDVRAVARITHVRDGMRDAVRSRVEAITDALFSRVQANLSGAVLRTRSGDLLNALEKVFLESATTVTGQVRIRGIPYAHIQEEGGTTAPHLIEAQNTKALAFRALGSGDLVFASVVHHPGSKIQASGYMAKALEEEGRDKIVQAIIGDISGVIRGA